MKKYTIAIVLSLFAIIGVSNAFAGGGFEDVMLNPDGTVKTTVGADVTTNPTPTPITYDEDGNIISQGATAGSALEVLKSPTGIAVVLLILLILGGFIYWSYNNSKPKSY